MCSCSLNQTCFNCQQNKNQIQNENTSVNVGLCELIVSCCEAGINSRAYNEAKDALARHEQEKKANHARRERIKNLNS